MKRVALKIIIAVVVIIALVCLYKTFSPSEVGIFPRCPTKLVFGIECPGCGSQRAIHHLLNFEIAEAIQMNILVVLSIPYLIIWSCFAIYFRSTDNPTDRVLKWRKRLFSTTALYILLAIIVIFTIVRNFYDNF